MIKPAGKRRPRRLLVPGEALYRAILASAVDYAIISTDLEGNIASWNEGARRLFGWTAEDLQGRPLNLLFTAEENQQGILEREMEDALLRGRGDDERWMRRKDGSRFWALGLLMPLRSPSDEPIGFLKILRDRTAERATSEALRVSQERLELALAAGAVVGYWDWDVDANRVVADARFADLYGLPAEEAAAGVPIERLSAAIHADDLQRVNEMISAVAAQTGEFASEHRVVDPAGKLSWVAAHGQCYRDDNGRRFPGIVIDITGRRDAATRLRASEDNFRSMAESIPQLAWMANAKGAIYWYNQRWLDYTGASAEDMIGEGVGDAWRPFQHPDHLPRVVEKITRCFESGEHWEDTFPLRGANGEYRWFLSRARPIRDEVGRIVRWFGTNTDVTEQIEAREALARFSERLEMEVEHRTEQLQQTNRELKTALAERARAEAQLRQSQKMEVVGQLTGGIAHDFNNLLTGIMGNLELIQKRVGAGRFDDLRRFTDAGLAAAGRAAALAQRLLSFSRPQAIDPGPVDVKRLIASMNALWLRTLGEKIMLRTVVPEQPCVALTDENQLENALLNLVINARDAMPDGGELVVEIGSRTIASADPTELAPGDYVSLCVRDSGIGMTSEVLARAFEPFFTTKPVGRGTGLGLSMIDAFVRQSGGSIEIRSELGRGTEISLSLPRCHGLALDRRTEKAPSPPRGGGTVLVVEDDDTVRALVAEVLDDLGYGVLEAGDASAAMSVIKAGRPLDLMVTDVGLPGINGRQLADMARQHRSDLKVLFVTGHSDPLPSSASPGTEMLTKPFELDALAAKIGAMISRG